MEGDGWTSGPCEMFASVTVVLTDWLSSPRGPERVILWAISSDAPAHSVPIH